MSHIHTIKMFGKTYDAETRIQENEIKVRAAEAAEKAKKEKEEREYKEELARARGTEILAEPAAGEEPAAPADAPAAQATPPAAPEQGQKMVDKLDSKS